MDREIDTGRGYEGRALRRISWGAVFAGAVVAVMTQVLLSLLGLGVGAGSLGGGGGQPGQQVQQLGVGAGIWWLIAGIISLFIGGLVAGRLARPEGHHDGAIHGVVVWALASLALLFSIANAVGDVAGGALSMMRPGQMPTSPSPQQVRAAAEAVSHSALWAFVFFSATSIAAAIGGFIAAGKKREHTIPRATARHRE